MAIPAAIMRRAPLPKFLGVPRAEEAAPGAPRREFQRLLSAATRPRCQKATKPIRTERTPIAKVGVIPHFLHSLHRLQPSGLE
jgi:hypothetical protein